MILKSAAQGYEPAEEKAGGLLLGRASFDKERAKYERQGVRYTIRAAFKGNLSAQQRLSRCYAEGAAFKKNPVLAYAWLAIAIKTAGGPNDYHAQFLKFDLDRMIANLPSRAIAEGQRIADNYRLTKEAAEAMEAELVVAQLRLVAIYLGEGRKAALVNQMRFAEGETNPVSVDGEPVLLTCKAIEAKSATFKLGTHEFTLTTR